MSWPLVMSRYDVPGFGDFLLSAVWAVPVGFDFPDDWFLDERGAIPSKWAGRARIFTPGRVGVYTDLDGSNAHYYGDPETVRLLRSPDNRYRTSCISYNGDSCMGGAVLIYDPIEHHLVYCHWHL